MYRIQVEMADAVQSEKTERSKLKDLVENVSIFPGPERSSVGWSRPSATAGTAVLEITIQEGWQMHLDRDG